MDSNNTIDIIRYVIRHTPFGHLKETIENLKVLVGSSLLEHTIIQEEIKGYEEDHFKQVSLNEEKIVISKHNKDEDNFYHDQSKNFKILINPLNENIEKIEKIENNEKEITNSHIYADGFSQNLHKNLIKLLNEYKDKSYKSGVAAVNAFYRKDHSNWKIVLIISAHNLNYKNFWTGEWLSFWEIQKDKQHSYSIKGNVKANTYYYEEGNIQFNLNKDFEENLNSSSNEEGLAKEIIGIIEHNENSIQIDLDQVYDNFSDNYIKPLRRKLPVTGTKMNWSLNQIGSLK